MTAEARDRELERLAVDAERHHLRACPVDDDLRIELRRERAAVLGVAGACVTHRADDELLAAGEPVRDLRLALERDGLALDVVPQELERLDTGASQMLALRIERLELGLLVAADVEARRDRVDELDGAAPRFSDELREPRQLVIRVRLAPQLAVIVIVLRCVHPRVEPVRAAEADQVKPLLVRPRRTVEAL